jgi:hypothetical protein
VELEARLCEERNMDYEFYLKKFKGAVEQLDKKLLKSKKLEVSVGIILDSVYLKIYKKEWTSDFSNPLNAEARIFFSIWLNDKKIQDNKIFYNIHALKLRKLKGYLILSKEFANSFRKKFKEHQYNWENVSINFGPLTLMEGYAELDEKNFENKVLELVRKFLEIADLIDDSLSYFEHSKSRG